jgi:hypothetical protein
MKSILLQILTLNGLGYLKLAAYQTFLVVLWIQAMITSNVNKWKKVWRNSFLLLSFMLPAKK